MAQRQIVQLVSDLSGTEMKPGDGQTIRFGWLGQDMEIDLTESEVEEFAKVIDPYVSNGRRLAKNGKPFKSSTVAPKHDTKAVKAWLTDLGVDFPERGRLPKALIEAYETKDAEAAKAYKA